MRMEDEDATSFLVPRFTSLLDKENIHADFTSRLQLSSFERLQVSKYGSKQEGKHVAFCALSSSS
jgi:hypothetical protein